MKTKSYVKGPYLDLIENKQLAYCEIIAESYYKTNAAGVYSESTPNTTEILNNWFKPVVNAFILRNNYFFIGKWCTGIVFNSYTQPDGVTVERLIFKPTPESCNAVLAKQEFEKVYYLTHQEKRGFLKKIIDKIVNIYYKKSR